MRTTDSAIVTALAQPSVVIRGMILFDLGSGSYGFWDGKGSMVYGGVTYQGGAQLIEVDTGMMSSALQSNAITLKLYANPDAGLTPDILLTIENEVYYQKPVTIMRAYFDNSANTLIATPVVLWKGLIDFIEHDEGPQGYVLIGHCESRSLDYSRRGWAKSSDAEQQQISTGDVFFQYAGTAGKTKFAFGQAIDTPKQTTQKAPPA